MSIVKKKGFTSTVYVDKNIVTKDVSYDELTEELITREIYWLRKLEAFDIAPKFISREGNVIKMSYCGRTATKDDFKNVEIQKQLIWILGVLFRNHCFYNDFSFDNFTIKDGRLYIIDFGWCPKSKEDYTCGGQVESILVGKPSGNYYTIFEYMFKEINKNLFLDEKTYYELINEFKGENPQHWKTRGVRWEYHEKCVELLSSLNTASVLEAGTMGISILKSSDTIDFDLPKSGWKLCYEPTYHHDLKSLPWPIKDEQYDVFIALRVFHHFGNAQLYFNEMRRISKGIIQALPKGVAARYKNILSPDYEYVCKGMDTTLLYWDLNK